MNIAKRIIYSVYKFKIKRQKGVYLFILSLILLLNICLMFISNDASARYKFDICAQAGCPDVGNLLCATIIIKEGGNSFGIACFQAEFNF